VLGGLILVGCGVLVQWASRPRRPRGERVEAGPPRWKETFAVALVVLGGSTQVFFLTSILPQVVHELGVTGDRTLRGSAGS